jgi:hypothetical protein
MKGRYEGLETQLRDKVKAYLTFQFAGDDDSGEDDIIMDSERGDDYLEQAKGSYQNLKKNKFQAMRSDDLVGDPS